MKTQDEAAIDILFIFLRQKNKQLVNRIGAGLSVTEIEGVLRQLQVCLPSEVKYFFTQANGYKKNTNLKIDQLLFFENGMLMSLQKCALEYEYFRKNLPEFSTKFPLFDSGGGDFLLIDIDKNSPTFNQILIWSLPMLIVEPVVIYDSFIKLISTAIRCHMVGAYRYNAELELEIDYDKQSEESRRFNKNSTYWEND